MNEWWSQENSKDVDSHIYIINDTNVYIGKRLDKDGCYKNFFDSIDLFISLNDDFINFPLGKSHYWIPWREGTDTFPEYVVYSAISILNYFINEVKVKTIYIHCDMGSHRAPSIIGAFLFNYVDDYQNVIKNAYSPLGKSRYFHNSLLIFNPIEYYNEKVLQLPKIQYFIKYMKAHPSLGYDKVTDNYHEILPYELLTDEQKKEKNIKDKIKLFYQKSKKMLKNKKFLFDEENNYSEFKCLDTNNEEAYVWLCALPLESYHGLFKSNIEKANIYIISPKKSLPYKHDLLYDYQKEIEYAMYENTSFQIMKIYKKD